MLKITIIKELKNAKNNNNNVKMMSRIAIIIQNMMLETTIKH